MIGITCSLKSMVASTTVYSDIYLYGSFCSVGVRKSDGE